MMPEAGRTHHFREPDLPADGRKKICKEQSQNGRKG